MIKYYDISQHDIDKDFITKTHRLDLELSFTIYDQTIEVEGCENGCNTWNERFNFEELEDHVALARIAIFKAQALEAAQQEL